MEYIKNCIICGQEFTAKNQSQSMCGKVCAQQQANAQSRESRLKKRITAAMSRKKPKTNISEVIRLLNIYNAHMPSVSYGKLVQMLDRKEVTKIDIERMEENATGNRVLSCPAIGQYVAAE